MINNLIFTDSADSDNDTDISHGTVDEIIVAEQVSEPELPPEIEKCRPCNTPKLNVYIPCSFTNESCDGL